MSVTVAPAPRTILDAMADSRVFGRWFGGPSWGAWKAFLAAVFALPMSPDLLAIYQRHTGRTAPPTAPVREAWCVVGRRGGKSRIAALVAVWLAAFRDYGVVLTTGERALVMVIAADRRQARVVLRYIIRFLEGVPELAGLIERRTAEALHLTNGISIEVHTASFRAVRGYTIVGAICDEIAFWPSEDSANPDTEILNALRPAMATVPGALLLCISSPYARRGALWEAYRAHYGQEDAA
jgi:phage terminase large subunit-like protein